MTFGWRTASIDDRARELQDALDIELEPRDSLYLRECYRWDGLGATEIIVQENLLEDDDGLRTHNRYAEHLVLVFGTDLHGGWAERIAALPGVERLDGGDGR